MPVCWSPATYMYKEKNYLLPFLKPTRKLRVNVNVILEYEFQEYIDFCELMGMYVFLRS